MTREEFEQGQKKRTETFCAVRDTLKKLGNTWAYHMCFKTPWGFYGKHSVEECVKILLEKYPDEKDGEQK